MKKRTVIIFAAVLAALLAASIFAWICLSPQASEGSKTITVNVHHLDGSVKSFQLETAGEFVRSALEAEGIIAGTEGPYGLMVTTVDGEKADEGLQQWWGYEINGETAMYGVESQIINDGDVIDFSLNEGY